MLFSKALASLFRTSTCSRNTAYFLVICAAQPEKCKVRLSESAPKDTNLNAVPPTVAQNLSVVEKHDEVVPDEQPCQVGIV